MSNQRLMKAKEKAGDGYAKTNAIGSWAGDPGSAANVAETASTHAAATASTMLRRNSASDSHFAMSLAELLPEIRGFRLPAGTGTTHATSRTSSVTPGESGIREGCLRRCRIGIIV